MQKVWKFVLMYNKFGTIWICANRQGCIPELWNQYECCVQKCMYYIEVYVLNSTIYAKIPKILNWNQCGSVRLWYVGKQ